MRYESYKKILILFFVVYFVGGLMTAVLPPWKDKSVIPFFSWFLFDRVPPTKRLEYVARVLEYQGKVLEQPPLFSEAKGIVMEPRSAKAREIIREFTLAILERNEKEENRLRRIFEQSFMPACVRYEMALIEYSPIERWKNGSYVVKKNKEFSIRC